MLPPTPTHSHRFPSTLTHSQPLPSSSVYCHSLPPTPIHSHPLPSTPSYYHSLPPTPSHSLSFAAHPYLFPLFLAYSHSFSAHFYPLTLIFSQLQLNLNLCRPCTAPLTYFQSTSKQFTSSLHNCILSFRNYLAVLRRVDGLSIN